MWIYNDAELTEIPEKAIGFVYEITNITNGKKYIGKKLFHFSKPTQKNLKKRKIKVESNWREYTGSNNELNTDIKNSNEIKKVIINNVTLVLGALIE